MSKNTETEKHVAISPPNFESAAFWIVGTAPLITHKFSQNAQDTMHEKQAAGSTAKKGSKKAPKDFIKAFEGATYRDSSGWSGFNASAIRCAAISACRLVGFKMTLGKLSLFVREDGWDGPTPLIRVWGEPEYFETTARLPTGSPDLRVRPLWQPGWKARACMVWDADQFTAVDIANLMHRIGMQVGIGEGRPDSKGSAGCGWGTFRLADEAESKKFDREAAKG